MTMTPAATINSTTASPLTVAVARLPTPTPSISRTIAPIARISSGRIGCSDGRSRTSVIAGSASEAEQCGLGAAERVVIVVDQRRHRGRRHVEDRLRIDAEQDGEDHERRQDRDLARADIADAGERRLVEHAENDLAIEPERIGGRQDYAQRRERRDPGVDLERADEGQKLTDEAGGAGQPD